MEKYLEDNEYDWEGAEERIQRRKRKVQNLFLPILGDTNDLQVDWLVENFIPAGYLCILAGAPKGGKTSLATAMALAVATGTRFAGRKTKQGGVLWISAEESYFERNVLLSTSDLVDSSVPLYTCFERLNIDDESTLDIIRECVRLYDVKLLVVDPLIASMSGRSLSESWNARKTLIGLKEFCASTRVTALVLHHRKRSDGTLSTHRVADNDQLTATASMSIVMTSSRSMSPISSDVEGLKSSRVVKLDCQGRGPWANQSLILQSAAPLEYMPSSEICDVPEDKENQLRDATIWNNGDEAIRSLLSTGPATCEELCSAAEYAISTIRNSITRLRRQGVVVKRGRKNHAPMYALNTKAGGNTK